MTKRLEPTRLVMLNWFQHPVCFYLLSADIPVIPVHRTGFSGVVLINGRNKTLTGLAITAFSYMGLLVHWNKARECIIVKMLLFDHPSCKPRHI